MALTKEQWFSKLKTMVPSWVFEGDKNNVAIFKGLAAVFHRVQLDSEEQRDQTFFDKAETEILNLHGSERGIKRLFNENNAAYSQRIKTIVNSSNVPALKAIVDSLLINGESQFIEHHSAENFLNRGAYLNRNIINFDVIYNAFTILVKQQIPEATTFFNRENFYNRESFIGSNESSLTLFQRIADAVNDNKALGTVYRLIERAT